jgi:hypothetical protein
MKFTDIKKVSSTQILFCKKIGIDVEGDTVGVAAAKIEEQIQKYFFGNEELASPTEKQIKLAKKFDIDISGMSRIVGNAVINDILTQLNFNAIKEQSLKPGVRVRKKNDLSERVYIISSISPDGTVYFKGGNGQRAWARNLINIELA